MQREYKGSHKVRMKKKRRKVVSRKLKKFLIGGNAKSLSRDDFRSARLVIPPSAFAYVKRVRVVIDRVDLETWVELQAAPDDVCLQTSILATDLAVHCTLATRVWLWAESKRLGCDIKMVSDLVRCALGDALDL